jgi:hypothetical protein
VLVVVESIEAEAAKDESGSTEEDIVGIKFE